MKDVFNFQDFLNEKDEVKVEIEEIIEPGEQEKESDKEPESQGSDDIVVDMVDDKLKEEIEIDNRWQASIRLLSK